MTLSPTASLTLVGDFRDRASVYDESERASGADTGEDIAGGALGSLHAGGSKGIGIGVCHRTGGIENNHRRSLSRGLWGGLRDRSEDRGRAAEHHEGDEKPNTNKIKSIKHERLLLRGKLTFIQARKRNRFYLVVETVAWACFCAFRRLRFMRPVR